MVQDILAPRMHPRSSPLSLRGWQKSVQESSEAMHVAEAVKTIGGEKMQNKDIADLLKEGEAHEADKDIASAMRVYNTILEEDKYNLYAAKAHFRLGVIYLSRDNHIDMVYDHFKKCIENIPALNVSVQEKNQFEQMVSYNLGAIILGEILKGNQSYDLDESERYTQRAIEIPLTENSALLFRASKNLEAIKKLKDMHGGGWFTANAQGDVTSIHPSDDNWGE